MWGANHCQPLLVGRAGELAALDALVRRARRGGGLAVIGGEAGIGKTRLVEAALDIARASGATVLATRAEELEAHRPVGAIIDLAGRERLEPDLGTWELGPM